MSSKTAKRSNGRDPGAPKRNMSAYLLYQNAMREQFKALNPGMNFGQLSKYTSAMYAEMPQQEKDAWLARAEADKARYLHELSSYVPPPGYDAKGDAIVDPNNVGRVRGPKRKLDKDPDAPKRNMSAYLLYQNAMREQFKQENPGMTFGQLAKYTSHMYKNLTPEEKTRWESRAANDKSRYDSEIAAYVPPPGYDARGNMIEERRRRKRNKRNPKDPSAPKRASGPYVFFANETRPFIMKENPNTKFVELGKVMGERWRAIAPEEKKRFEAMAAQDKVRFQQEMTAYNAKREQHRAEEEAAMHHAHAPDAGSSAAAAAHYYQQPEHDDAAAHAQASYVHYDPSLYHNYHAA